MISITFRIEGGGEEQFQGTLTRLQATISDLSSAFRTTGEYLVDFFANQVFESEGAIFGHPWTALSPKYALWKSTHYPGRGILERTGTLRRGFKAMSTATYLTVYNNVEYGKYHQAGTSHLPQRVLVALGDQQREQISAIILQDIISRAEGTP